MKLFNDNLVIKIMGFLNVLFLILSQFLLVYILYGFFQENIYGRTGEEFFYNILKVLGVFIASYLLIIYYRFFQILLKKLQD